MGIPLFDQTELFTHKISLRFSIMRQFPYFFKTDKWVVQKLGKTTQIISPICIYLALSWILAVPLIYIKKLKVIWGKWGEKTEKKRRLILLMKFCKKSQERFGYRINMLFTSKQQLYLWCKYLDILQLVLYQTFSENKGFYETATFTTIDLVSFQNRNTILQGQR